MSALNRMDGFLLERLRTDGAYQAGIYASAYRLLDAGNMVGYLFAAFLVPYIARHRQQLPDIEKAVLHVRHFLIVSGGVVAAFVIIFSAEVQEVLYHFSTPFSTSVLQYGIAVLPAYLLLHIYGSLLTASMQLKTFLVILGICVLINAVLNVFLIPIYGAKGCAVAALISQYFCAISAMIIGSKKFGLRLQPYTFFIYLMAIGLASLLFYILKYFAFNSLIIAAVVLFMLCLVVFAYIPFVKKTFLLSR